MVASAHVPVLGARGGVAEGHQENVDVEHSVEEREHLGSVLRQGRGTARDTMRRDAGVITSMVLALAKTHASCPASLR